MKHALLATSALSLGLVGLSAATAAADPKSDIEIVLTCGEEIVEIAAAGNGQWTPAHDLNTTLVGVPLSFGEFTGVFTPVDGDPVPFTEPAVAKRNEPKTRNLIVDCAYTVSGANAEGTFEGYGTVRVMVPRAH